VIRVPSIHASTLNIYAKIGATNRVAASLFAVQQGLLSDS
jgi:DNA-binding CsgD family transcriptional regulator